MAAGYNIKAGFNNLKEDIEKKIIQFLLHQHVIINFYS
jgi:hypothetical protein